MTLTTILVVISMLFGGTPQPVEPRIFLPLILRNDPPVSVVVNGETCSGCNPFGVWVITGPKLSRNDLHIVKVSLINKAGLEIDPELDYLPEITDGRPTANVYWYWAEGQDGAAEHAERFKFYLKN